MSFYKRHLFFCNNIKDGEEQCCSQFGAKNLYTYAKSRVRDMGLLGEGNFGVSESRCLGRCEYGPVMVVYPDNVWYQYIDQDDVDEVIDSHLLNGETVVRLKID